MKNAEDEIMLRRLNVEDALAKLDQFLNNAFNAGLYRVRVIHGKGTGTMRLVARRELSNHPLVESFRTADPHEGGDGAMMVQLTRK